MWNAKLWRILINISKMTEVLYGVITMPLRKYALRILIRLPFSTFYFRPLFLYELYMALGFLWEPYVRKNLVLNKGDVFIDVGANIGYYTVYASKKVGNGGLVVAIEPDARNLLVLHKNIKASEATNVRVLEAACGFDGSVYLVPGKLPGLTSTIKERKNYEQKRIRSISLNTLIESISVGENSNVFVKIDVEGGEIDVIRGGLSFIKRYHPTLIIETFDLPKLHKLQETIEEIGYRCSQLFRSYYCFSPITKP